jgi:hypothetical protein
MIAAAPSIAIVPTNASLIAATCAIAPLEASATPAPRPMLSPSDLALGRQRPAARSRSQSSGIGSNASFKLFQQWPEQPGQRSFPASVERIFLTEGGNSRPPPRRRRCAKSGIGLDVQVLARGRLAKTASMRPPVRPELLISLKLTGHRQNQSEFPALLFL